MEAYSFSGNSYYCGFECFDCKNKRDSFSFRKRTVKSPALLEEKHRKIKIIDQKGEDRQPALQMIIEVLKDELDMAWDMKMKDVAVDPEKEEPLRLSNTTHADTQALIKRWNEKRKRSMRIVTVGEDRRVHKKQKKVEASPTVELKDRYDPGPTLHEDFLARLRAMEGSHPILVLQKRLFKTDTAKVENRLSVPVNQIRRQFLTEEEERRVVEGMEVTIIEPSLEVSQIMLKKWRMKTTCYLYVLTTQWNSLVARNSLNTGDLVQVWSFRVGSELGFALVKV